MVGLSGLLVVVISRLANDTDVSEVAKLAEQAVQDGGRWLPSFSGLDPDRVFDLPLSFRKQDRSIAGPELSTGFEVGLEPLLSVVVLGHDDPVTAAQGPGIDPELLVGLSRFPDFLRLP